MSSSKRRALGRQRERKQVADIVKRLPIPYVLEAVARRLELRDGWLEVRLRDGFVELATRVRVMGIEEVDLPEVNEERGWTEERTHAVTKSFIRAAEQFERAVELKFDGDELRSLLIIHEYTAAELAKDHPIPTASQRTRKRRVEL